MSNPTGKGGFKDRPQSINRKGRPRNFDALRKLAQMIGSEETVDLHDPNSGIRTAIERILRQWAKSREPQLQKAFVEIAYGKTPDAIEMKSDNKVTITVKYAESGDNTPKTTS